MKKQFHSEINFSIPDSRPSPASLIAMPIAVMTTWLSNPQRTVLACVLHLALLWALAALPFLPVQALDGIRPALAFAIAGALTLLTLLFAVALRRVREQRKIDHALAVRARLVALGEMTTSIAHEISQPLTVIQLAAHNALADGRGDEERGARPMGDAEFRAYSTAKLERICRQVDRAAGILARMRISGRHLDDGAPGCDMRSACRSAVAAAMAVLQRDGITLQLDLPVDPLPVAVPQATLEQVISGLLSNAREALLDSSSDDRRIVVTASRVKDRVLVRVADNGPGIAPQHRERIFEPFFTTKSNASHLGLGLSLAFGVVHDADGRLSLLERGEGAVFQIELPAEVPPTGTSGAGKGGEQVPPPRSLARSASSP